MNRLGAEIGRLRKELGITQKQLAKLVGVSEGFIIDVESGRRILNEDLIKKFSRVLRGEVGKLELYEPNQDKPEPDRNVVKVVEKPVQDIWNDALSGILMTVPVYRYKMDKAVDAKQLPIIQNKVEGFPKDKVAIENNAFMVLNDFLHYSIHFCFEILSLFEAIGNLAQSFSHNGIDNKVRCGDGL